MLFDGNIKRAVFFNEVCSVDNRILITSDIELQKERERSTTRKAAALSDSGEWSASSVIVAIYP